MKLFNTLLMITILTGFSSCFNSDDLDPIITSIEIIGDTIVAEGIEEFGKMIEVDHDHLLVSSLTTIYVFQFSNQEIILVDTLMFDDHIGSMAADDDMLAVSIIDSDSGVVYLYKRNNDSWDHFQEIRNARFNNYFGSDIDIEGDFLVIGDSAPWGGWGSVSGVAGKIFIYRKTSNGWELQQDFFATDSKGNDQFGDAVAIHQNLILAGSGSTFLHIYEYNNDEWTLKEVEKLRAEKIEQDNNHFLIQNGPGTHPKFYGLTVDNNGNYLINDFIFPDDFNNDWVKDFALKGDTALIDNTTEINLYAKSNDNNWRHLNILFPEVRFGLKDVAISDDFFIFSGEFSEFYEGRYYPVSKVTFMKRP